MHKILLVEDDVIVALDASLALEDGGYGVLHADNAVQAFDVMEAGGFAALITDVNLGPGEDGFAVARRWRSLHPGKAVIFLSGEDAAACADKGVQPSEWFAKPFAADRMLTLLDGLLRP